MISRARHGVIVTYSKNVPANSGVVYAKQPSQFFSDLRAANYANSSGVRRVAGERLVGTYS